MSDEINAILRGYDEWCKAVDPDGEVSSEALARLYDMNERRMRESCSLKNRDEIAAEMAEVCRLTKDFRQRTIAAIKADNDAVTPR